MRFFKGTCKFPHIKTMLTAYGYIEHFIQPDGTYVITTTKNTFEVVPRSTKYYDVYLVR